MTEHDISTPDILKALASLGITELVIDFDGGGDNGQITNIEAKGLHTELEEIPTPPDLKAAHHEETLEKFVDAWAYALLYETGYDWVNNEGGYGQIIVTPPHDDLTIDMNIRIVTSEQYMFSLDPETGVLNG